MINGEIKMAVKKRYSAVLLVILTSFLVLGCSTGSKPAFDQEKVRNYANTLYNHELYQQAVEEYQRYLDLYPVKPAKRANIWFTIGNIYFERLHDYEKALAYYLKVKTLYPESLVMDDVNKKIVASLERLQRSNDAKLALDDAVNLKNNGEDYGRPGDVVATIGDKKITSGDLNFYISQMPDYVKSQIKDANTKKAFLVQHIATDLFFDAAKRAGYDKDKDVIEGTFQAKKSLMVQKYLEHEIPGGSNITEDDVKLFYQANKDKYVEKDKQGKVLRQKSFDEVKNEVASDLLRERQQKAYEKLLQRMMQTENVKIYDDKIK